VFEVGGATLNATGETVYAAAGSVVLASNDGGMTWQRRTFTRGGAVLVALWHVYAVHKGPLLIATPWETLQAFGHDWSHGTLRTATATTLRLLGEGVASNARHDPQAKAVGEWLGSRKVDVPEVLL